MGNVYSQFFPSRPTLTERNTPDQSGRVFLVTGGYAGVGLELCKILYAANATVWIAGRSESKARAAIDHIKRHAPKSSGQIHFMLFDLSDLSTIKPAVDVFATRQKSLDVLVNNAGVMYPPTSTDAQGNDLQIGTNCLGHYLLYQLLLPLLSTTAASAPSASVRVLWAASIAVHVASPKPHGMILENDGRPTDQGLGLNYGQTKVGNVFFAREFAKTTAETAIVHTAFNPGNLRTELQRHWTGPGAWITDKLMLYPAIYGAYTELWAALSPELTMEKSGSYVYPWGRFGNLPAGVEASMQGSDSAAARFVSWCHVKTQRFM